jgi:hypothetical protein
VSKTLVFQDGGGGGVNRLATAQVEMSVSCTPQKCFMFERRNGLTGSTTADVFV